jgi:hypothetical protein
MFCPKCGLEQAAEGPNSGSRCGFQLTEVTSMLARGEVPIEAPKVAPLPSR